MSIKESRKELDRSRSRAGHLIKKLHREERESARLISLKPFRKTSREAGLAVVWLAFAGFALLLGSLAGMVQTDTPEVKAPEIARTYATEPNICGLDSVDCPDEPQVQAEAMPAGSPMAGLGDMIVETATDYGVDWKVIIGIADAESSLGRSFYLGYDTNCHNYWGIKPPAGQRDDGSYLRCYYTDEYGVKSIAALLSRRYKGQTPEQMCGIYVQPCNPDWLRKVNEYVNAS